MRLKRRNKLDMATIKELEKEFGSLANVPKNHPKLNEVEVEETIEVKNKRRGAFNVNNNNLEGLTGHLFDQLDKLNDDDLTTEELEKEVNRAGAIANISKVVIETAKTALEGEKLKHELGYISEGLPAMLEDGSDE